MMEIQHGHVHKLMEFPTTSLPINLL